jgi:hypothetical protein
MLSERPSDRKGNLFCRPRFAAENDASPSLAQRKRVLEHIDDLPFYLDYIDSDFSNAVAFRDDSYAFIGITVPLVCELLEICARLSESAPIRRILSIENTDEVREGLSAVLFQHLLSLVLTHEFTHHVHGHVLNQSESNFFSEFTAISGNNNIERQAEEADADGYAAYHVLANFIEGETRKNISAALKLANREPDVVDQVLFSCFVIVAGAFYSVGGRLILQKRISMGFRIRRKPGSTT